MVVHASGHIAKAQEFRGKLESAILFPLMTLMMTVALLMFLWGAFEYIASADSEEGQTKGRTHMLFGIIGLLIMVSAYGILKIALDTFGI